MTHNLLITGAGVDCTKGIGFPMAATLLPEIAAYIEGEGKSVDQTLRIDVDRKPSDNLLAL